MSDFTIPAARPSVAVSPADLDRAKRWSIGQPVTVTDEDGAILQTTTRSAPFKHQARWVILVDGVEAARAYVLGRVQARDGV